MAQRGHITHPRSPRNGKTSTGTGSKPALTLDQPLQNGCLLAGSNLHIGLFKVYNVLKKIFDLAATIQRNCISPKTLQFQLLFPCQWNRNHYNIDCMDLAWEWTANNPQQLLVQCLVYRIAQWAVVLGSIKATIHSFSVSNLWLTCLPTWLDFPHLSAFGIHAFNHCAGIAAKSCWERR